MLSKDTSEMKCKICGNAKENQIYEAREMMFGYKDVFDYFHCSQCNCLQIKDFPKDISKYYPDNYYSCQMIPYRTKIKKYLLGLRDNYALFNTGFIGKLLCNKYPNERLRCLSYPLQVHKDTSILDVGCGTGSLLYSLRKLGFKNLLGVDPFNSQDIEYANGLKILKKEIHDVKNKWGMVMFHHSFEHIPDPVKTLQTVSGLLAPSGKCIIRIPISSSYAWVHYGVNWVQLDAPRHFYLHSVESMHILADQAKLDLYKVIYDSTSFQFWGSEQYIKDIPLLDKRSYANNPRSSIFSKEQIHDFDKRAKVLNETEQGDQAVFYLRKP
jgi:SAM-dependent methyltransferase